MSFATSSMRVRRWYGTAREWGLDPRRSVRAARGFLRARRDRVIFEQLRRESPDSIDFPILGSLHIYGDAQSAAGIMRGHYFHQDLVVAQDIFRRNPRRHIDVGSRLDGFVAHVASFREITVLDIRPASANPPAGISFVQQDLTSPTFDPEITADSVSCLHALEHFGLGRYGDPIDFDGWRHGLTGLRRLLEPRGMLYLSVPVSRMQRVEFNAQRVFSIPFLRKVLEPHFTVERLDFVDDKGDLLPNQDPYGPEASCSFDSHYGCAIWTLRLSSE